MGLKDLTKIVEESVNVKAVKEEVVEVTKDILHENSETVDLGALIAEFYEEKDIVDAHKKRVDKLNAKIKEVMIFRKLGDYSEGGYEAVLSTQNRASLNEDKLLETLKDIGEEDLIVQKEVPNVELIEDRIYNNEFNAAILAGCMEYKEVHNLKVKKSKKVGA